MKLFIVTILVAAGTMLPLRAQTPDARDQAQLVAKIREIKEQQAQIADNQKQIDTKMANLAETIRVARLLAGRGGK